MGSRSRIPPTNDSHTRSTEETHVCFLDLPDGALITILQFMDGLSALQLSLCSHGAACRLNSINNFWQDLALRALSLPPSHSKARPAAGNPWPSIRDQPENSIHAPSSSASSPAASTRSHRPSELQDGPGPPYPADSMPTAFSAGPATAAAAPTAASAPAVVSAGAEPEASRQVLLAAARFSHWHQQHCLRLARLSSSGGSNGAQQQRMHRAWATPPPDAVCLVARVTSRGVAGPGLTCVGHPSGEDGVRSGPSGMRPGHMCSAGGAGDRGDRSGRGGGGGGEGRGGGRSRTEGRGRVGPQHIRKCCGDGAKGLEASRTGGAGQERQDRAFDFTAEELYYLRVCDGSDIRVRGTTLHCLKPYPPLTTSCGTRCNLLVVLNRNGSPFAWLFFQATPSPPSWRTATPLHTVSAAEPAALTHHQPYTTGWPNLPALVNAVAESSPLDADVTAAPMAAVAGAAAPTAAAADDVAGNAVRHASNCSRAVAGRLAATAAPGPLQDDPAQQLDAATSSRNGVWPLGKSGSQHTLPCCLEVWCRTTHLDGEEEDKEEHVGRAGGVTAGGGEGESGGDAGSALAASTAVVRLVRIVRQFVVMGRERLRCISTVCLAPRRLLSQAASVGRDLAALRAAGLGVVDLTSVSDTTGRRSGETESATESAVSARLCAAISALWTCNPDLQVLMLPVQLPRGGRMVRSTPTRAGSSKTTAPRLLQLMVPVISQLRLAMSARQGGPGGLLQQQPLLHRLSQVVLVMETDAAEAHATALRHLCVASLDRGTGMALDHNGDGGDV